MKDTFRLRNHPPSIVAHKRHKAQCPRRHAPTWLVLFVVVVAGLPAASTGLEGSMNDPAEYWWRVVHPTPHELVSNTDAMDIDLEGVRYPAEEGAFVFCANVMLICQSDKEEGTILHRAEFPRRFSLQIDFAHMNHCSDQDAVLNVTVHYLGNQEAAKDYTELFGRRCSLRDLRQANALVYHHSVPVRVNSNGLATAYVATAAISTLCCVGMIVLYSMNPVLQRFPSNIMFWRTVVDLIFSVQFVYLNTFQLADRSSVNACTWWLAFLTQFCLFASLAWYFVLALNFFYSISNPFSRPSSKYRLYHYGVWISSFFTGVLTLTNFGYRRDFQLCWNQRTHGFNWLNWTTYFFWVIIFSIVAVGILAWGFLKLRDGSLDATLKTRKAALHQTRVSVTFFSIYVIVGGSIWYTVFTQSDNPKTLVQDESVAYVFTVVVGLMGLVDVATWIYVQWEPLMAALGADERKLKELMRFDDISDALRYEFIKRTSRGICDTVLQKRPQLSSVVSMHDNDDGGRRASQGRDVEMRARTPSGQPVHASGGGGGGQRLLSSFGSVEDHGDEPRRFLSNSFSSSVGGYAGGDEYEQRASSNSGGGGEAMFRHDLDIREVMDGNVLDEPLLSVGERVPIGTPAMYADCTAFDADGRYDLEVEAKRVHQWGQFTAYAPRVFDSLRAIFGISAQQFANSIRGDPENMKKNFSEGRSGQFMYFTVDRFYLVKTLTPEEHALLLKILPSYYRYMRQNDRSLICRFYGLFSIRMYAHTEYFVVMNNVLLVAAGDNYNVDEVYDLKGSRIDRHAAVKPGSTKATGVYKDNDLHKTVRVAQDQRAELIEQMKCDARYLASRGIMDYSLLLGIHNCTEPRDPTSHCSGNKSVSQDTNAAREAGVGPYDEGIAADVVIGPGIYHLGIIDVLQRWTLKKRLERLYKIVFRCHCHNWRQLSAVDPHTYANRFERMLHRIFGDEYLPYEHEFGGAAETHHSVLMPTET